MINEHCLLHRQLVLSHDRKPFTSQTKDLVEFLLTRPSPIPPPFDVFFYHSRTRFQQAGVELHLDRLLSWYNIAVTTPVERLLCEIILLHRMHNTLRVLYNVQPQAERAYVLTGAMIQDRLIRILLQTNLETHPWMYALCTHRALDKMAWELNYRGAAAVTRFIEAASELDGVTIRLPTLEDDLDFGIDLFLDVLPHGAEDADELYYLALSIKSSIRSTGLALDLISSPPLFQHKELHKRLIHCLQKTIQTYETSYYPVGVLIGQTEHDPHSMEGMVEDAVMIERFFKKMELMMAGLS